MAELSPSLLPIHLHHETQAFVSSAARSAASGTTQGLTTGNSRCFQRRAEPRVFILAVPQRRSKPRASPHSQTPTDQSMCPSLFPRPQRQSTLRCECPCDPRLQRSLIRDESVASTVMLLKRRLDHQTPCHALSRHRIPHFSAFRRTHAANTFSTARQ